MSFSADAFFAAIDVMDSKSFSEFFHTDGSFTFANNDPQIGRTAVAGVADSVFNLVKGISHERTGTWSKENFVFNEGLCTYHRKDNKLITIPYFSIVEVDGDLVKSYRAYVDSAPLFA